jgi:hypothetical protein
VVLAEQALSEPARNLAEAVAALRVRQVALELAQVEPDAVAYADRWPQWGSRTIATLMRIDGIRVAFLSRHGKGHRWLPTEINFRANIFALKKLGVGQIISVSAVGSLRQISARLDVQVSGRQYAHLKHAFHQNASAYIVAYLRYRGRDVHDSVSSYRIPTASRSIAAH